MKKGLLLIVGVIILSGCISFPPEMIIQETSRSIVGNTDNDYNIRSSRGEMESAASLKITFTGKAPFAYMQSNGFQQQLRCYIYKSETEKYQNSSSGNIYFDKLVTPADRKTNYSKEYGAEKYQYALYAYKGLKARSDVNGSFDIDLIMSEYSHIECGIWGVKMFGPFVRSNVISISRKEFVIMNEEYGS